MTATDKRLIEALRRLLSGHAFFLLAFVCFYHMQTVNMIAELRSNARQLSVNAEALRIKADEANHRLAIAENKLDHIAAASAR